MKGKNVTLLFIFFFIVSANLSSPYKFLNFNGNNINLINKIDLKNNGYWNLTGSNIFIDDLDPSRNWSYTASHYDWCSGSGTWTDPYIIENVTIDGQDAGNCIFIKNSVVPFIIRNCTLSRGIDGSTGGGIKLINVDNGFITQNNCLDNVNGIVLQSDSDNNTILDNIYNNNYWHGIFIEQNCDNNNITGNTAQFNYNGLYMRQSCIGNKLLYNTFTNNTYYSNILYDTGHGIRTTAGCNETNIVGNIIVNNTYEGILLGSYCYNSKIINNKIKYNGEGIYIGGWSEYSLIKGNEIIKNRFGGIEVDTCPRVDVIYNKICNNGGNGLSIWSDSDYCTVKDNLIIDNSNFGIDLGASVACDNNYIYNNSFIGNGQNAREYDWGSNNHWDNGTLGNFWDDYPGEDNDGNGIGDTPYNVPEVPPGTTRRDNYPIYRFTYLSINDASSNNWAWAKANGYCTGSGSYSDPYIIKDLVIDDNTLGYLNRIMFKDGVIIRNSNNFFRIENCAIVNLERTAISLFNTRNGYIYNNNFSHNGINGILMNNGDNTTIYTNLISNNGNRGFDLYYCNNDNINNNVIQFNTNDDIRCEDSSYLTFKNNIIQNIASLENSIYLWDCDHCLIESNYVKGQWIGIYLNHDSDFNNIIDNFIHPDYYGIMLNHFDDNNNKIYKNTVIGATVYAMDEGFSNHWDNGSIGNYWGNYGGVDANDDGIGDTPYSISGSAGSQDRYPIWDDGEDGIPPDINILFPTSNAVFSMNSPSFIVSIKELYIHTSWYQLVGGSSNYTFTGNSGVINQTLWDEFGDGLIIFRVYVNDTSGYIGYDEVMIFKDVLNPDVSILSPQPNDLYGRNPALFSVFVNDINLDIMWYSLDGGLTNITFINNGTFNSNEWSKLQNGTVTIKFYAIDKAGNIGTEMVTIRIDILNPEISIISPQNNDLFGVIAPEFEVSYNDPNLNTTWYVLNGKSFIFNQNGIIDQFVWDSYGNGTVMIIFYGNDSVGNIAYEQIIIQKDILGPDINIIEPIENNYFTFSAPQYHFSVIDNNLDSIWYTLDNGLINITCYNLQGIINQSEWNKKDEGIVFLKVFANDTVGNLEFIELIVYKDTTVPIITVNLPSSNQLFGIQAPTFNINITELHLQEKWYSLNGGNNIIFTNETQFDQSEWDKIDNGTVIIIFYAIDEAGNMNLSKIIVRKDGYVPDIIIISPLDEQKFGRTAPDFNISIIEEDLVSTWYTIEGIAGTFSFTGLTGTINQDAWDDAPEAEITITFYALDRAGNIGSESVVVIKSISSTEPVIPGYNIFLILGVLLGLTILLNKIKKKS